MPNETVREKKKKKKKYIYILYSYNPPSSFCGLSLDKTDHVTQKPDDGYQTLVKSN